MMQNPNKIDILYTITQVAKFLGVDTSTVRRWVKKKLIPEVIELPSEAPNRANIRIPRSSLAAIMIVNGHAVSEERLDLSSVRS